MTTNVIHDPTQQPAGRIETKNTTCYMCACRCGIRVTLRDGEVRYIQGNPDHPLNKGVICAKGASGIMKQYSPARLTKPLLRKPGTDRGDAQFEEISWDKAFDMMEERLAHLRATDPAKFALFTGRDQMQALTGLFAKNYGTPNYAAHGGFCSVNMAAGMIYSIGGSFWEFGGPDLERAKLFVMIGTAEDHHSNPMKIALSKFKRQGGKLLNKPSKASVLAHLHRIKAYLNGHKQLPAARVVQQLNPVIRGWANYYRHGVSKEVFYYVDHKLWRMLWLWARRRHPKKSAQWVKDRYFGRYRGRDWIFGEKGAVLLQHSWIPVTRHVKVPGKASPLNPAETAYWSTRSRVCG